MPSPNPDRRPVDVYIKIADDGALIMVFESPQSKLFAERLKEEILLKHGQELILMDGDKGIRIFHAQLARWFMKILTFCAMTNRTLIFESDIPFAPIKWRGKTKP